MKNISTALFLSTLAGLSLGLVSTAHAQTTVRFSTVEFRDTTLNDALEIVFQAANNPAHTIDPSASMVPIGAITLQNIQWDNALRTLANQNNFKVSRGADGSYLVEPREPVLQNGGEGGGMMGGAPFPGGFGSNRGGGPSNPFGGGSGFGGARPAPRPSVNFEIVPPVSTRSNAQTTPRFGTGGTGGANNSTADQQIIPITVRHIYVGGIAQLFNNSSTIDTQGFVSPGQIGGGFGGGGFGGGGFGGGGFGGGGFGGGGFGGGGFGGGGFGGQQGGFGGGFGGQQGGFGGGFGGQQGGFGGGSFGGGGFGF